MLSRWYLSPPSPPSSTPTPLAFIVHLKKQSVVSALGQYVVCSGRAQIHTNIENPSASEVCGQDMEIKGGNRSVG